MVRSEARPRTIQFKHCINTFWHSRDYAIDIKFNNTCLEKTVRDIYGLMGLKNAVRRAFSLQII